MTRENFLTPKGYLGPYTALQVVELLNEYVGTKRPPRNCRSD